MAAQDGQPRFHLSSLNKALDVLEAFTFDRPQWSLGELGDHLGLAKPTLRRVLQNLVARGYVRQDPDLRRYRLGMKSWEVGVVAIGGFSLNEVVKPHLRWLAETTGEQATLWVYDQGDGICIDRAEASQRVRSYTRLGTREPAHLLAGGRCVLAYQDAAEFDRLASQHDVVGDLAEQLARVRERGYEVSHGDRWPDVYAVGSPIRDHTGMAVAALCVSGPAVRFEAAAVERIAKVTVQAATMASEDLGFDDSAGTEQGPGSAGGDPGRLRSRSVPSL